MNLRIEIALCLAFLWPAPSHAQAAAAVSSRPLQRHYREGERLIYHMKGINESWHYEVDAEGVVKKDATGRFFEEYQCRNMTSDGKLLALAPSAMEYREKLSLDPRIIPSAPDLKMADPKTVGPITDLMTFYSDLWLANMLGMLKKP